MKYYPIGNMNNRSWQHCRSRTSLIAGMLPVMEAWMDGATIQVRLRYSEATWVTLEETAEPDWNPKFEYRVKPRLTEGYFNIFLDGRSGAMHPTRRSAKDAQRGEVARIVFLREVEES